MALFGNKDKNLPLLTKVQQIRLRDSEGNQDYTELTTFFRDWQTDKFSRREMIEVSGENFDILWNACEISQNVLSSLVINTVNGEAAIKVSDAHRMRDLLKQLQKPRLSSDLLPSGGGETEWQDQLRRWSNPDELIAAYQTRYVVETEYAKVLAQEILDAVGRILDEIADRREYASRLMRPTLGVCKECCSVFIVDWRHPNQAWCSARCTDRVFARKKRLERKNEALGKSA